jgi:hypothetical protein
MKPTAQAVGKLVERASPGGAKEQALVRAERAKTATSGERPQQLAGVEIESFELTARS